LNETDRKPAGLDAGEGSCLEGVVFSAGVEAASVPGKGLADRLCREILCCSVRPSDCGEGDARHATNETTHACPVHEKQQ